MSVKLPNMEGVMKAKQTNAGWFLVVVWMGVIFFMSTDALSSAHTGRLIIPVLHSIFPDMSIKTLHAVHFFIRKCGHFTEYGILSWLWFRTIQSNDPGWSYRSAILAFLLSTVYAASDEFHQSFVPSRGPSFVDVGIDTAGAAFSLLMLRLTRK